MTVGATDGLIKWPWSRPVRPPDPPLLTEKECLPFLEPRSLKNYLTYVAAATSGRTTPMINGRGSNGKLTEAFDSMQKEVAATSAGDSVYLAAWMFNPDVPLTLGPAQGSNTWGELFQAKAMAGVLVRILMTEFDSRTPFHGEIRTYLIELDKLIDAMPQGQRAALQYQVTKHPVRVLGMGLLASHHQKFMIVRRAGAITAFCGGLDIATLRTPPWWTWPDLAAWHDIHLKLEGRITRDLEFEFISRWNREQGQTDVMPLTDWGGLAKLKQPPLAQLDQDSDQNAHRVQMHRTISVNRTGGVYPPQKTTRDDIWQSYEKIIGCTRQLLYMENQYFREFELADVIARRAREVKDLKVILIVPATLDEGNDLITEHGNAMQYRFFERLTAALGPSQLRAYSMALRFMHSKLILADDVLMSVGSCNANRRGFRVDTELNVALADEDVVRNFRRRLWSHNLGVAPTALATWQQGEIFAKWDAVATTNLARIRGKTGTALAAAVASSPGECIVPFDYRTVPGKWSYTLPNEMADLGQWAAGDMAST